MSLLVSDMGFLLGQNIVLVSAQSRRYDQSCDHDLHASDNMQLVMMLYTASTWVLPVLLAVTLHEAAHGFVAHGFGDDTAWRLGRVTFNPLKHIDPFGTILLPAFLLLLRAPFLFGYAKPVPVQFRALRNPRRDMIWVAAAGPVVNLLLAILAGVLLHVANMLPLPPLDGGRVAVGILPDVL